MKIDSIKAKTALLKSGKTQTEISTETSISRRWVGEAFNKGSVSEKTAHRIAQALGVPVESILETEEGSDCP